MSFGSTVDWGTQRLFSARYLSARYLSACYLLERYLLERHLSEHHGLYLSCLCLFENHRSGVV